MDGFDAERLTNDALRDLGILVSAPAGSPDQGWDFRVDPGSTFVEIKYRTLIDLHAAHRLLGDHDHSQSRHRALASDSESVVTLLAVGDRVTEDARRLLTDQGAGYYDLRGHIALRTNSLVIDVDVAPRLHRAERKDLFAGKVGLEVATALLMHPTTGSGVRQLARQLGRAPSRLSEVVQGFIREGYLDDGLRVVDAKLFWQVAERWYRPRTYLSAEPPRDPDSHLQGPLRLGLGDPEDSIGWALTDSLAAVAYGAPLAVRSDQISDFYVPDVSALQRAEKLLGSARSSSEAASTARVAPVPAVCSRRIEASAAGMRNWPLAHPVFVALDLAQDAGRGREILEDWTPDHRWHRVW
jgi:hypothetical protein